MESTRSAGGEAGRLTVVEEGTEFRGSITSSCALLVRGRISGDVNSPGLTVTPTGVVTGKVKVGTLSSQGEIMGEFEAEQATLSGKVSDETVIRAKSLEVKLTADAKMTVTFGETRLEVGDDPAAKTPA
ncbi:MAG: polymer-forming cytoskeletal protein [Polyangiaceae bacterium]